MNKRSPMICKPKTGKLNVGVGPSGRSRLSGVNSSSSYGAGTSGYPISPKIIQTIYLNEKGELSTDWHGESLDLDQSIEALVDMLCKMAFNNRMTIFQEEKKQKLCRLIQKEIRN